MAFHDGELAVQRRAGVGAIAARVGRSVAGQIEPAAAHFLERRYVLYVGSLGGDGRPWASQLVGPPGFVRVVDERTVRIAATPAAGDPLLAHVRAAPGVGLLAIDPPTRRRYRVNGDARVDADGVVTVAVREAFGNCPKYIRRREPVDVTAPAPAGPAREGDMLTSADRALVEASDTFFLATAHATAGVDVSHRGGPPGFVRVLDDRTLAWPDYVGNMMFQSLGNVVVDARAGLLFVDFAGTRTLHVAGRARVDWDPARAAATPGAERVVELTVDRVLALPDGNPLRWRPLDEDAGRSGDGRA